MLKGDDYEMDGIPRKKGMPTLRPAHDIYTGVPTGDYDNGRDEKPWQRIPCALLLVLLGGYLLLGYLTQLVEDEMPRVINEVDVPRDSTILFLNAQNSELFSEEAAWRYLNIILGDEPRVSGTKYHYQKTKDLKDLVDSVASQANIPVRTDWQITSNDYWLTFALPHANIYQNVSNVIAVLEGESGFHPNGTIGTSLLVNCHYDSVPFAMGTSDDAIFCAVMMESLSKLARRSQKLKHNIVFLFNGAEENTLQGSHGFLSHEWSRGITNVVNLDAAGMNGKPIVFQVSDPRLLSVYKRLTKRPCGQSIGEFLFATGVIPSDTDFRIWRDFGNFHGIDIAFIKWALVYHTRYDHPSTVIPGVIQNAGDTLLPLIRELADLEELDTQVPPMAAVYYDYLYAFLVTYSFPAAVAIDLFVAVFAGLSVAYYVWLVGHRWSTVQELLFSVGGRMVAMLAGFLVTAIFTPIMVASTTQMRYLSQPWIVVAQYWLPYIITAVCVSQAYDAWRTTKSGLSRSIRTLQAQAATRLILAILLLALTCVPKLTTMRYMFTVPLFLMTLLSFVSLTVVRYVSLKAWQHLMMEVVFSLPSTMFMMSLSLRFCAIMLPTMNRTPTDTPDYTIAIINVGLAAVVSSTVSGVELLFSRRRLWLAAAPVAATCVVLMFVPFQPYQDDGVSTQRHYWFHSEIISYDYNNVETARVSGVLVTKYDAYTLQTVLPALRERGVAVSARTDFSADCQAYVHCNLPLYRLRFGEFLKDSLFLYTNPPAAFVPDPSVKMVNRTCVGETCTLNFLMTGTAHNTLTLWPRANVTLTSWSLVTPLRPSLQHASRPVYVIIHSVPTYSEVIAPFAFSVTLTAPQPLQSSGVVELALHSHKIHHPEEFTQEYRTLLDSMPAYFNIASFLSIRKNYVF